MAGKRGSVVMISLWILAIMAVFAVGVGHRAMIEYMLSAQQSDALKAREAASAGAYKAMALLSNAQAKDDAYGLKKDGDHPAIDLAKEFDNGSSFKVTFSDERGRLNINALAALENPMRDALLKALFSDVVDLPLEFVPLLVAWVTSSVPEGVTDSPALKHALLRRPEELRDVLEYYYKEKGNTTKAHAMACSAFDKIKDYITVYTTGSEININTASEKVLAVIGNAVLEVNPGIDPALLPAVIAKIMENRIDTTLPAFTDAGGLSLLSDELGMFGSEIGDKTRMSFYCDFTSDIFRIESIGTCKKTHKKITVIYDRGQNPKILAWIEG
jgi:type II secretory pathway component PulK